MGGAGRTAGGYRAVPSDTDTSAIDSDANAVMTDGGDQESSGTGKSIFDNLSWIENNKYLAFLQYSKNSFWIRFHMVNSVTCKDVGTSLEKAIY